MQRIEVSVCAHGLALLAIGQQQLVVAGDDPILWPGHVLLHQRDVVQKGAVCKESFEPLAEVCCVALQEHALRQRAVALLDQQGELEPRHYLRDDFRYGSVRLVAVEARVG